MPSGAGFYTFGCTKCTKVFELPSLGDMNYGEILLYGERGAAHRYVCVLDHAVWNMIEAVLPPPIEASMQWWQVLATLADPIAGERLQIEAVCPHCQADNTHFRTPKWASKTPRVGEVEDATFEAFLSLPEDLQRARVVACVRRIVEETHF